MRHIGVISDTHGLLRQEALDALQGSELIIHAGDVGEPLILDALSEIAPVRAVYGNTDWGTLRQRLPATEVIDLLAATGVPEPRGPSDEAVVGDDPSSGPGPRSGALAYLLHDKALLDLDPYAAGFRVVIFGHTHEPLAHEHDGVLWLNPGSAGPRRFRLPVTVARMTVVGQAIEARILDLETGAT